MVESKVGRMGAGFYVLFATDDQRLGYLWQRSLFTDLPNVPSRQRLEFYETWNDPLWVEMFAGLNTMAERVDRFREYLYDGDISLRRLHRSPTGMMHVMIYDGKQIIIDDPPESAEAIDIGEAKMKFPKSLAWSNLVVKERL